MSKIKTACEKKDIVSNCSGDKRPDFRSAILFVNNDKKKATELTEVIKSELEKINYKVKVISVKDNPGKLQEDKWDIAFSLGGDGTVLSTARCMAPLGVPILPVNMGTLGFIAEVNKEDWFDVFCRWERNEIIPSRRCMFEISVIRGSKTVMTNCCLNDAVISATGIAKLINLDVHIEHMILGTYRCDGLILATPTGSTAYSMAAGGPIVDPEMEAVIINPICPFTLSNRPFVLPSSQTLAVTVLENQRSGVLLTIDGQDTFLLECNDKILVRQAHFCAQFIFNEKYAYYSALKKKLFWQPSLIEQSVKAGDADA
jgi:NAD+ kinase